MTSKHVAGYAVTLVVGVVAGAWLAIETGVSDSADPVDVASATSSPTTSTVIAVVPTRPAVPVTGNGTFRVPEEISPGLYEIRATDLGGTAVWCSDLGCNLFNTDALIGVEHLNPDEGTRFIRVTDETVAVVLTDVELTPARE